jgi:hypothetical protein
VDISSVTELGVGGLLAFLVIKAVLDYLSKKTHNQDVTTSLVYMQSVSDTLKCVSNDVSALLVLIRWLKDVHEIRDKDGVLIWYTNKALIVDKLADIESKLDEYGKIIQELHFKINSTGK